MIRYIEKETQLINCKVIATETKEDPLLSQIIKYVVFRWPTSSDKMDQVETSFYQNRYQLSIENNVLLWGIRIVIPESLQNSLLEQVHESHFGIVRMKQVARSFFWWPNIDLDIDNFVNSCNIYLEKRKDLPKTSSIKWPSLSLPWERIHDLCGPLHNDK